MPMLDRLLLLVSITVASVCIALLDSHVGGPVGWTFAGAALLYGTQVVRGLVVHVRFVRSLRRFTWDGELHGVAVRFGYGLAPFVAGVLRPRIYCDPRQLAELTTEQGRAVLLHEQYHQRRRDPLRLQCDHALRPLARLSPALAACLDARAVSYEIAADRHALRHGASRGDMAGALTAMLDLDGVQLAPAFASAFELRVRALADPGDVASPVRGPWVARARFAAAVAVLVFCVFVV